MWITSEPLSVEDAKAALQNAVPNLEYYIEKGQLEILPYTDWYLPGGDFNAERVLRGWMEKEKSAVCKGFAGLRLTGNTFWVERRDWKSFIDYEATVNSVIGKHQMIAICTYSLKKCTGSDVIDVIKNHNSTLIRKENSWHLVEDSLRRKQTENALKASLEKYSMLVEKGNDGIVIIQDGVLKFANRKIIELTGFTLEEALGKPFTDFVSPEYRNMVLERYERRLKGEKVPERYEIEILTKKGSKFLAEINATAIEHDGKPADMAIIRDITERKRIEEERFRIIGEVTRIISHDLRNPLQALRLAADIMREDPQAKRQELIDLMNRDIEYMDRLLKNLIDFSSIPPLELMEDNVNIVLKEALSQIVIPKNVKLTTNYSDLPNSKLDGSQLAQVFINLILNGVQAMPEGGELNISTAKLNNSLEIKIRDTGIGIPKKDLKEIFKPFYTTKARGVGLGLPNAKRIVENHGGTIAVESEEGKGTTVTIRLPIIG